MTNDVTYLNETVWCKIAPSAIHGVGVVAIRDIPVGAPLTDYDIINIFFNDKPKIFNMKQEDFNQLLPEIQELILDRQIFGRDFNSGVLTFVSPNRDVALQNYMNHSHDPNSDGKYALVDIKKGEEITEDFTKVVTELHPISRKHFTFL